MDVKLERSHFDKKVQKAWNRALTKVDKMAQQKMAEMKRLSAKKSK